MLPLGYHTPLTCHHKPKLGTSMELIANYIADYYNLNKFQRFTVDLDITNIMFEILLTSSYLASPMVGSLKYSLSFKIEHL